MLPSAAVIKDCMFSYDPSTGILYRGPQRIVCGCLKQDGYLATSVKGREIKLHRLIWYIQTGKWPVLLIDHIDRNPTNNKWNNLREACKSQNGANLLTTRNTSGFKGVTFHKKCKKWQAAIKVFGKPTYLGLFVSAEDAHAAYVKAAKAAYGEYARFA